jgi:3-hydroxyisobutyrate dehydrogenase
MATQTFEPVQWKVQTLSKDLNNAVQLAAAYALNIPVASQALSQLKAHQEAGYSETDLATVIQHVQ